MITVLGLEKLLKEFQIPIIHFGTGKAKKISDLLEEINNGDCEFVISQKGLCRKVSVVRIKILYKDFILIEDRQVFKDGRERKRELSHLGEKIHCDEEVKTALKRACAEELGIESSLDYISCGVEKETRYSSSYPGLKSEYLLYDFTVTLKDEQFNKEGYVEKDEKGTGLTTYFKWVPNEEKAH